MGLRDEYRKKMKRFAQGTQENLFLFSVLSLEDRRFQSSPNLLLKPKAQQRNKELNKVNNLISLVSPPAIIVLLAAQMSGTQAHPVTLQTSCRQTWDSTLPHYNSCPIDLRLQRKGIPEPYCNR